MSKDHHRPHAFVDPEKVRRIKAMLKAGHTAKAIMKLAPIGAHGYNQLYNDREWLYIQCAGCHENFQVLVWRIRPIEFYGQRMKVCAECAAARFERGRTSH